ncbi:MAG TPA: lipocalin-like domain-containing protein [Acidobacteriota bacterium]|nr:lipocalin-like domain-containing protein [Acidobacteriota bacterium]
MSLLIPLLLSAAAVLGASIDSDDRNEWKHAKPGYQYRFPQDHASHPDYALEWWYYTGNVGTEEGQLFGYQLTFFRIGLEFVPANPSRWAVRDLFAAHLAVSDLTHGQFHFAEKMNRAGIGWAGAATDTYRVWNEEWEARLDPPNTHRLRAGSRELGIELELLEAAAPVIHGEDGISRKGKTADNASHYYSLTRMPTRGRIYLQDQIFQVEGQSWMDHEFGTTFLEDHQLGWDWFSIQLDNKVDLMVFQLRRADGGIDTNSSGTLVLEGGKAVPIRNGEFTLEPLRIWESESGARYPVSWRVSIPKKGISLIVEAALDNQELRTTTTDVTYWEGSTRIRGTWQGQPITGKGYLEMTGYTGQPMGRVMGGE